MKSDPADWYSWRTFSHSSFFVVRRSSQCFFLIALLLSERSAQANGEVATAQCLGFEPSILRHSGIWGAADRAVLDKALKKSFKKSPFRNILRSEPDKTKIRYYFRHIVVRLCPLCPCCMNFVYLHVTKLQLPFMWFDFYCTKSS